MIRSTSISLSKRSNLIRSLSSFIIDKSHKPTGKRSSDVIKNKDGKDRIILFDTTLRDGEQSPGATLNLKEKLQIAVQLSRLGIDVCEAGFPIASPGDFEAVKAIATQVGPMMENREEIGAPMRIAGLSRAAEKDIKRCYEAVKHAPLHRIHTFLATSDIHLVHKLKISRDQCIEQVSKAVAFASSLCEDVEFSTEDAGRSDPDFLCQVLKEAIRSGARVLNIPDTVGFTTPEEYQKLIAYLIKNTEGSEKAIFSTHCHNDLGLATANTLAGVLGGARQVEVTINGIGERAGNTALEELVMALRTRPNQYPVYTTCNTTHIIRCSRMVSSFTGMPVQPNKAIVGANAFAHEAGIHQDGVLKHADTYEIMRPESVGLSTNSLVLGKHSGKHAFKKRLEELGYSNLGDVKINEFVEKFKRLADEKKVVTDADMESIVNDELYQPEITWQLKAIHVTGGNRVKATATVTLEHIGGNEVTEASVGTGPVDAIFQAIGNIVQVPNRLKSYQVHSVTSGIDSIGEVTTQIIPVDGTGNTSSKNSNGIVTLSSSKKELTRSNSNGVDIEQTLNPQSNDVTTRTFTGHGADTDILVASARSYLSALNKLIDMKRMRTRSAASNIASAVDGKKING